MFSIKNGQDFEKGATPIVEEIGPIVYREYVVKENLTNRLNKFVILEKIIDLTGNKVLIYTNPSCIDYETVEVLIPAGLHAHCLSHSWL